MKKSIPKVARVSKSAIKTGNEIDKVFVHLKDGGFLSAHIWFKPSVGQLRDMVLDFLRMTKDSPYNVKSVWVRVGGVSTQYTWRMSDAV